MTQNKLRMHTTTLIGVKHINLVLLNEIMALLERFKEISVFLEGSNYPTFPYIVFCVHQLLEECEPLIDTRKTSQTRHRETLKIELLKLVKMKMPLDLDHYIASLFLPHMKSTDFIPDEMKAAVKVAFVELPEVDDQATLNSSQEPGDKFESDDPPAKRSKTAGKVLALFESFPGISGNLSSRETAVEELERYMTIRIAQSDIFPKIKRALEPNDVFYGDILGTIF